MNVTALDVGYGWTKAKYGSKIFRQPSVLGDIKPLHDENRRKGYLICDNYFVGELAVKHSDIKYHSLKDSKATTWTTEVLIKSALAYLGSSGSNTVTGLPVDYFFSQREQFEEMLKGLNYQQTELEVINEGFFHETLNFHNIKIVPQPLGAAMNYLLDDWSQLSNKEDARGRILVVDWGRYTLDLLVLDGMEIHKASCSPPNLGIESAYRLLRRYIREKIDRTPENHEMDRIVTTGEYEGYDVTPLIDLAFTAVAQQVLLEIEGMNLNFNLHLIVGGQAERLSKSLPLENKVVGNQLSNLEGYEKIGNRAWGGI